MVGIAKALVRRTLKNFGYELQKVGGQSKATPINVFSLVVEDLLHKKADEDFFFLQIGAHDGVHYDPMRRLIKKYHWRGILVEPQPKIFRKLVQNYRDEPQLIFENAAIATEDGEASMYAFKEAPGIPDHASMLVCFDRQALVSNGHGYKGEIEKLQVPALTLRSLLEKHNVRKLDLLQVDTEGYDFHIIQMLKDCDIKPTIINFESAWMSKEQSQLCDELFTSWGYRATTVGPDTVAYPQREEDSAFEEGVKNLGYEKE